MSLMLVYVLVWAGLSIAYKQLTGTTIGEQANAIYGILGAILIFAGLIVFSVIEIFKTRRSKSDRAYNYKYMEIYGGLSAVLGGFLYAIIDIFANMSSLYNYWLFSKTVLFVISTLGAAIFVLGLVLRMKARH